MEPVYRGPAADQACRGEPSAAMSVAAVNGWVCGSMTALNRQILAGARPGSDFADEVAGVVLPGLLPPVRYPVDLARRLTVLMGLVGAGLGRHFQERGEPFRRCPEQAFTLPVGRDRIPFLDWFAKLAERTGTGHPPRDTYASLTRWNLPGTEVRWAGAVAATLPSMFDDGAIHTYTGEADEVRFFELLKLSETLERAVNQTVEPLAAQHLDPLGGEAVHRLGVATVLLDAMRRLNADFAALPPEAGLRHRHFMDVFRQFAVHWRAGDVPPSGALDPESIERDFVLGTDPPGYRDHLRRLWPGLLDGERNRLAVVMDRPSIPALILDRCRLTRPHGSSVDRDGVPVAGDQAGGPLARYSLVELRTLVEDCPAVAAAHLLLAAHARMSGVHLMLSKKFLFNPQRERDRAGVGDTGVVSNRRGTTGMDENALERFTRYRQQHSLAPLKVLPTGDLGLLTGLTGLRAEAPADLRGLVRFTGPAADRLAAWTVPIGHTDPDRQFVPGPRLVRQRGPADPPLTPATIRPVGTDER